jgi:hypothetical protein
MDVQERRSACRSLIQKRCCNDTSKGKNVDIVLTKARRHKKNELLLKLDIEREKDRSIVVCSTHFFTTKKYGFFNTKSKPHFSILSLMQV